jgi:ketosteroid isomerase-like protein
MKARGVVVALLALALASTACQPPAQEVAPLSEEEMAAIRAWHDKYLEFAGDSLAALMVEDAVLMPPNAPLVDLSTYLEQLEAADFRVTGITATVQEIDGRDGLAYLRATYSSTFTVGGESGEGMGKYLVILRKQPDGSWLASVWIWNSNVPRPQEDSGTEE